MCGQDLAREVPGIQLLVPDRLVDLPELRDRELRRADALPVRRATRAERVRAAAVIALGTLLMVLAGDAAPDWDALTTITSIVAIYRQARQIFESWILWLTALTQVAFGTMCVPGLRAWRRSTGRETVGR